MNVICLDTNILVWGVQKQSSSNRKDKIPQAKQLIATLQANKNSVIIPTVVLAELLMGCQQIYKSKVLNDLEHFSKIVPFDAAAAYIYSELSDEKWGVRQELKIQREKMKFDMMVVATAISQKAECIYAGDDDIFKIVEGSNVASSLQVRPMPPYQPSLFDYAQGN
ncbi:MAG: type II toxin-antitoxin system VapC family toxin [Limnothrix sp.]